MSASNRAGAGFMTLAMAFFAIEDAFFKAATQDLPVGMALLLFGVLGFAGFALLCLRAGEPVWHPSNLERTMLVRSAFELAGRLFYALALAFAPLASTSAILQAAPLFVTLGAVIAFGEHVGPRRWVAMAAGFIGVLLIIRPGLGAFEISSLFALIATIGFAGRDLATRASSPEMSPHQLGALGFLVLIVAGLIVLVIEQPETLVLNPLALVQIAAASLVGIAAYSALTHAMRAGDVGFVAPYRYTRLLFALLLAFIFFGERPDALVLIGAGIVILAGLYSLARADATGRESAKSLHSPKP